MTTILANISKAAQTRTVNVGGVPTLVTDFNVAENTGFGDNQKTRFYRVTVWRERGAKLAPHLTLGRPVYIVGNVDATAYIATKGENAGKAVAQLEITNPMEIRLIGKKPVAEDGTTVFDGDEVVA